MTDLSDHSTTTSTQAPNPQSASPSQVPDSGPYGQYPASPATSAAPSPILSVVSFVLSAIAVIFLPIILGPAAIVCAGVGLSRHERPAKVALVLSVLATILGMVLGFVVWSSVGH